KPLCAARTLEVDIRPVVEISQRVGIPIEVAAFIGSSPIRQYAEGWTIEEMVDNTRNAVRFARQNQLPVMYVTEDTTRAQPETLRRLFGTAIEEGAQRVAVCDTVGHSTPDGARAVVGYVRQMLDGMKPDIGLDWHGHSDRGFGLINAIVAAVAGRPAGMPPQSSRRSAKGITGSQIASIRASRPSSLAASRSSRSVR